MVADTESLHALCERMGHVSAAVAHVLSKCAELTEAQHPDLWQGTATQLALSEQLRTTRRLVHRLGLALETPKP